MWDWIALAANCRDGGVANYLQRISTFMLQAQSAMDGYVRYSRNGKREYKREQRDRVPQLLAQFLKSPSL